MTQNPDHSTVVTYGEFRRKRLRKMVIRHHHCLLFYRRNRIEPTLEEAAALKQMEDDIWNETMDIYGYMLPEPTYAPKEDE